MSRVPSIYDVRSVTLRCPICGKLLRAPTAQIGKRAKCPKCASRFIVAKAVESEPAPIAESPVAPDQKAKFRFSVGFAGAPCGSFEELAQAIREAGSRSKELRRARSLAAREQSVLIVKRGILWIILTNVFFKDLYRRASEALEANRKKLIALDEELHELMVPVTFDFSDAAHASFRELHEAFGNVMDSERIWDEIHSHAIDRFRERTLASHAIETQDVVFSRSPFSQVNGNVVPLFFQNADGHDFYLYPTFAVVGDSADSFEIVPLKLLRIAYKQIRFHTESVPRDAEVIGSTWLKANKDGSPDRRFRENREIPIIALGEITIRGPNDLHEVFLVSNANAASRFSEAYSKFCKS